MRHPFIAAFACLAACGPYGGDPDGAWLAGDLHVHSSVGSNDTDGLGTPEALGPAMEKAGLDFVFITDHSNAQGSMHCDDVEDCPNLGPELPHADWPEGVWLGSEISPIAAFPVASEPVGHVGCLPLDGESFPGLDAFIDRPPGAVTGGETIAQCQEHGGFAIVNHPFAPVAWIAYDWTSEEFDALEVYNGGGRFNTWDAKAVEAWEERVASGQDVVAVGGSDCHRWGVEPPGDTLNPALGWPTTWVRLHDGEIPIDAIRAGRVVIAEPGSELSFVARNRRSAAGPGDSIEGTVHAEVHAQTEALDVRLELKEVGGEVIATEGLPGKARLELELEPGVYYARIWPVGEVGINHGGVALTNPIWVD